MTNTRTDSTRLDSGPPAIAQPRRRWRHAVWLVLVVLIVAGLAWIWNPARHYAQTGASYGARVACSCRYLGGRTLNDCHKDMEGAVGWVSLSDDPVSRSVTARYPLFAAQTATYREGWGCQLQPWTGGH